MGVVSPTFVHDTGTSDPFGGCGLFGLLADLGV